MRPFNREKFLLWMLAGLLAWQCSLFTYGTVMCANVNQPLTIRTLCPDLADNYSKFVQVSLLRCSVYWLVIQYPTRNVPNSPYGYLGVSIIRESPLLIVCD